MPERREGPGMARGIASNYAETKFWDTRSGCLCLLKSQAIDV